MSEKEEEGKKSAFDFRKMVEDHLAKAKPKSTFAAENVKKNLTLIMAHLSMVEMLLNNPDISSERELALALLEKFDADYMKRPITSLAFVNRWASSLSYERLKKETSPGSRTHSEKAEFIYQQDFLAEVQSAAMFFVFETILGE